MAVRANWHLDTLIVDESDPFAEPDEDPRGGEPVDLTAPDALSGRLLELLEREGQLEQAGITCTIKNPVDSCCSACPLRGSYQANRIQALCKLGTEQERTTMALRVAHA